MAEKELKYEIIWDEITDRPKNGNYSLFHYGDLEYLGETYPFTVAEMHDENIGYTSYEFTWVEGCPDGSDFFEPSEDVLKLQKAIIDSLEDERWKIEQKEIEEHKRQKDIDDERAWNGIKD